MLQKERLKNFFKIILIIALFVCINYTNGASRKATIFEELVSDFITAPQKIILYIKNYVEKDNQYFASVEDLKKENDMLNNQLEEMKVKVLEYESLKAENEVLKKHIKLADLYPDYLIITADIIAASTSNWEYTYVIDRGSNHGIEPNMAVITEGGLVRIC